MLLILFGLIVVIIALLADRVPDNTACPEPEVKYLPRNLDMLMKDAEDVGSVFAPMFRENFEYDR